MKKSLKSIIDNTELKALEPFFNDLESEKVSKKTISKIQSRVVNTDQRKKAPRSFKKWIPALASAACFILIFGVVLGTGIFNKRPHVPDDTSQVTPPGSTSNADDPIVAYLDNISAMRSRSDVAEIAAIEDETPRDYTPTLWNGLTVWKCLADALDAAEDDSLFALIPMWKTPQSPYKTLAEFKENNEAYQKYLDALDKDEVYNCVVKDLIYKDIDPGLKDSAESYFKPFLVLGFGEELYNEYAAKGRFDFLRQYVHDGMVEEELLIAESEKNQAAIHDYYHQYDNEFRDWIMSRFVDAGFLSGFCYRLGIKGYIDDVNYNNVIVVSKKQLASTIGTLSVPDNYVNIKPEDIEGIIFTWANFDNGVTRDSTEPDVELPQVDND